MFYFKNYLKQVLIINKKKKREKKVLIQIFQRALLFELEEREREREKITYSFFIVTNYVFIYLTWRKRSIDPNVQLEKWRKNCIVTKIQLKSMSFYVIEKTENI